MANRIAASLSKRLRPAMEQITAALKHAEAIRLEVKYTAMQIGPFKICHPRVRKDRQDDFKDINEQYHDCLTVATLISKLCTSTAYQQDHRMSRLSELLRLVKNAADEFVNSFDFIPGQARSVNNPDAAAQTASMETRLESSMADIAAAGDAVSRVWQSHNDEPILSGDLSTIASYFDRGPYDWPKVAECLRQDQGTMVIEAGRVPIHQVRPDNKPLWSHHELEMETNTQYTDCGAVNSMWCSLDEKGIVDSDDLEAYRKLCKLLPTASLVFTKDEEVSCGDDDCEDHGHLRYDHSPGCRYKARWAPHELAVAMIDMQVDLGFVFCDDHSIIVWPLGKVHEAQCRCIVLYCRPEHQPSAFCYNLGPAWHYSSLCKAESRRKDEEHNELQASIVKRPKGILDLPPELRMQIYDAYFSLASEKWRRTWWHLAEMALPALCMVNRQFRDEVASQWLASWKIHCESSWDSSYVADQVLGYGSYIGYLLSSRPLIHSLSISYKFHEDMIDIDLSEQARDTTLHNTIALMSDIATSAEAAPGMHRLLRMQLDQLSHILHSANVTRRETTSAKVGSWSTSERQQEKTTLGTLKQLDKEYHERLVVSRTIIRLCMSAVLQQPHRFKRLQQLLQSTQDAADRYTKCLHFVNSLENEVSACYRLHSANKHIALACKSLSLVWEYSHATVESSKQGMVDVEQYFDTAPYDHRMLALRQGFDKEIMVIEHYLGSLTTVPTDKESTWWHSTLQSTNHLDYGAINSIWHSLTRQGMRDAGDRRGYLKLCGLLLTAWLGEDVFDPDSEDEKVTWAPKLLSIGLRGIHIDLGIIFGDDTSVVIWPLGKSDSTALVIYCTEPSFDGRHQWQYRSLVSADVDQDANTASTESAPLPASIAQPKTLFDLPAELRNAIYTEYFLYSERDSKDVEGRAGMQKLNDFTLPRLCAVNRQLLLEVAPLWLGSTTFSMHCFSYRRVSTRRLVSYAIADNHSGFKLLPSPAHIRHLEYNIPCHGSLRITVQEEAQVEVIEDTSVTLTSIPMQRCLKALRELVQHLVADNRTGGLSPVDAAVVLDFVWHRLGEKEVY
ncbi:hypothetical protein LTS10_006656 [Elasticomyces elasticus]|nr:hypothetical protein LTS10_006656 [Elasticomyces elasticus]